MPTAYQSADGKHGFGHLLRCGDYFNVNLSLKEKDGIRRAVGKLGEGKVLGIRTPLRAVHGESVPLAPHVVHKNFQPSIRLTRLHEALTAKAQKPR